MMVHNVLSKVFIFEQNLNSWYMQEVVSTCLSNIIGREKNHTVCPQLEEALHTHNTKQQVFPATIKSCVIKDEILTNNIYQKQSI